MSNFTKCSFKKTKKKNCTFGSHCVGNRSYQEAVVEGTSKSVDTEEIIVPKNHSVVLVCIMLNLAEIFHVIIILLALMLFKGCNICISENTLCILKACLILFRHS